jgi:hypothetical protein
MYRYFEPICHFSLFPKRKSKTLPKIAFAKTLHRANQIAAKMGSKLRVSVNEKAIRMAVSRLEGERLVIRSMRAGVCGKPELLFFDN